MQFDKKFDNRFNIGNGTGKRFYIGDIACDTANAVFAVSFVSLSKNKENEFDISLLNKLVQRGGWVGEGARNAIKYIEGGVESVIGWVRENRNNPNQLIAAAGYRLICEKKFQQKFNILKYPPPILCVSQCDNNNDD